jgi:preprotein translocase subunit SecE
MTRKQIFTSVGVVLAFVLVVVLVMWGPSVLWQMVLAMHGR